MRAFLLFLSLALAGTTPCEAQDLTPPETAASSPSPSTPTPAPSPSPSPAPAPASDERFLVAPLGGDAPGAMVLEALDAVRATLAAEGFAVVDPADVATIDPARLAEARRLDDLRPVATELGASGIATVAVWTSDGAASSVIVSLAPGARSFSATHAVDASGLGEAAVAATRAALLRRRDALLVSAGTSADRTEEPELATAHDTPPPPPHDDGVIQNGQLFGIVGPGLLAALGAAGIGAGVYASLDETCDYHAPSGVCLRGERPNYALGIVFIGAGTLALAGAIVWWILGAESEESSSGPRIDVVMGPDGGGVTARGRF